MKTTPILLYCILSMTFFSCTSQPKEDQATNTIAPKKASIDLLMGSTPKEFSAKTTDGNLFVSKANKGKFWVIFMYENSYLTKSDSYDLVAELNETHKLFDHKIEMIGIANGFSDDEAVLQKQFKAAKFNFPQIDNTEGPNKEKQLNDNVFCTPAKILIDPNGKVIYNGCGGHSNTLNLKLDSLIKANKL